MKMMIVMEIHLIKEHHSIMYQLHYKIALTIRKYLNN